MGCIILEKMNGIRKHFLPPAFHSARMRQDSQNLSEQFQAIQQEKRKRFHLGIRTFFSRSQFDIRAHNTPAKLKANVFFHRNFCEYFSPVNMKWFARQQIEKCLSKNECTQNNNRIALLEN